MKQNKKQLFAVIALIIIGILIIAFVISAFIGTSQLFFGLLAGVIALPILTWIFIAIYGKMTQKSTIADLFPESDEMKALKAKAEEAKEAEAMSSDHTSTSETK